MHLASAFCFEFPNSFLVKGCSRNYPRGGAFYFRPLHPQDTHGVRAPRPPGHVSALIDPPHYGSNTPWPPGQVTPHPSDTLSTKHPPPQDQKVPAPPPQDNFWNSPKQHVDRCLFCFLTVRIPAPLSDVRLLKTSVPSVENDPFQTLPSALFCQTTFNVEDPSKGFTDSVVFDMTSWDVMQPAYASGIHHGPCWQTT